MGANLELLGCCHSTARQDIIGAQVRCILKLWLCMVIVIVWGQAGSGGAGAGAGRANTGGCVINQAPSVCTYQVHRGVRFTRCR
jgi:hypothetical protein